MRGVAVPSMAMIARLSKSAEIGFTAASSIFVAMLKWKRDPLPTMLFTPIDPSIASTRRRLIASPKPVPPNFRVVD